MTPTLWITVINNDYKCATLLTAVRVILYLPAPSIGGQWSGLTADEY